MFFLCVLNIRGVLLIYVFVCCLDFHFHLVKSFSIDTYYRALAYEGVRVYLLYETEYFQTLALFSQQTNDLCRLSCPVTMTIKDSHGVVGITCNIKGYFLIFL